jgi:cutinase
MKFFAVSLLATLAAASPIAAPEPSNAELETLVARQLLGGSKDELEQGTAGSCPKAILVFARGSTEIGNLVRLAPYHRFLNVDLELTTHKGHTRRTTG